jgi:hypothetical protein
MLNTEGNRATPMPPEPTKALPRYRFEFCNTIQMHADT